MGNKLEILKQLQLLKKEGKKAFAVLIDPDDVNISKIEKLAQKCNQAHVDFAFFGGSIMVSDHLSDCICQFKKYSDIPVILFPGSPSQLSKEADGLLFLSLISGRNPELLIGQHVISAPLVKASGLEVLATGYVLIDGGVPTTVSYISHSVPIPNDKPDLALCTAWAGELLGKQLIYMDAGSGAKTPISAEMIKRVSSNIDIPLIIGGGIKDVKGVETAFAAGAQVVVVGNAIEKDESLIIEMSAVAKMTKVS
ncbi:MAG TPA: geranylgeranylglyceryl/heptaprenylglyceryl phosphate synthase [Edaphocola sp.]|nr:geranylgeranylglyceryl/heptaprenylglyceryl phosphate synthase [Edaphocola sp.]